MKFSQKFYPDAISCETLNGEKTYYDVAYHKEAADHVLGLLSVGASTEEYYQLANSQAIVDAALEELDGIFNGVASQSYTGEFIRLVTRPLKWLHRQNFILYFVKNTGS